MSNLFLSFGITQVQVKIGFMWITAHKVIEGNDSADHYADRGMGIFRGKGKEQVVMTRLRLGHTG